MTTAHPAEPGITVLVATRDRVELLRAALASIWAQRVELPLHVVVVFDGAFPDGFDPARDLPAPPSSRQTLRVVTNAASPGLAGARNHGLSLVDTEYVALCDDDDRWRHDKLPRQLALADQRRDAVAVGGGIVIHGSGTTVERRPPATEIVFNDLLRSRVMELHPSTLLLRAEDLRAVGGWDETLAGGYAEDYDLLLRLARRGPLVLVDDIVADILWSGQSYYFSRWQTIAHALEQLLAKVPEFAAQPSGRARVSGQIAFALASSGEQRRARTWVARALRDNRREPRAWLAAAVAAGVLSPEFVQRRLHARGRGI